MTANDPLPRLGECFPHPVIVYFNAIQLELVAADWLEALLLKEPLRRFARLDKEDIDARAPSDPFKRFVKLPGDTAACRRRRAIDVIYMAVRLQVAIGDRLAILPDGHEKRSAVIRSARKDIRVGQAWRPCGDLIGRIMPTANFPN